MRDWLIALREGKGLGRRAMAEKCECSYTLLLMLEEDNEVTHPNIAARIADEYGITDVNKFNTLIPKNRSVLEIPKRVPKPTKEFNWEELMNNEYH